MDSQRKQFYLGDDCPLPTTVPSVEIVIDESNDGYQQPSGVVPTADDYDYKCDCKPYYYDNQCLNGAITPESKNSSNASLLSSNSNAKDLDFSVLQTIIEKEILPSHDSPNTCPPTPPFGININREEALLTTSIQIFIAFMIAGFGNVGAGLILDYVQHWSVFIRITEMFVLVPSLLGLKGNLEMTMAARLSTHANLGNMQHWKLTLKLAKGNIALVQCQATVVSFLAAIVAIIWSVVAGEADLNKSLTLVSSSLITANVACFALGSCMICIIVFCDKIRIDPDNIATPIAASLGDVTTAALLACFAQLIHNHTYSEQFPYIAIGIIIFFLILLPFWIYLATKNEYTKDVVTSGWYPVIAAMMISSCGGFILDYGVALYDRIALFQPIINGVGGNLVAVHASRISTSLFRYGKPGVLFPGFQAFTSPFEAFFTNKNTNIKTSRILLLMALPAHILYIVTVKLIDKSENIHLTAPFFVFYLFFALLQVSLLLYMAYNLVHILWLKEIDPDSYAIPLLTSSGDFLGSAFLLIVFKILYLIGDPNTRN
ncbi:solute carrier family 41 member 1-like [Oppia nitens]|uniref:solute carrier family 41 member 1-like n=1 Tax=Oppia nitens TaxID=1686743 RepID=UPI0023DBAE09|nr:solute carrier family 41 member 1-like [Oppia nitens]